MGEWLQSPALFLGIVPLLILVAFLMNYPRARRWQKKARSYGSVTCRSCGHVGELDVRAVSASSISSSNLRIVCAKCSSTKWGVDPEQGE